MQIIALVFIAAAVAALAVGFPGTAIVATLAAVSIVVVSRSLRQLP